MGPRKQPPAHKCVPGAPGFVVDGFRFSGSTFFLTHCHGDHYTGMDERWSRGPVYCTEVTAKLVRHILGVAEEWVHAVPLDTPTTVAHNVTVTFVDANHCPGSAQLIFKVTENGVTKTHIHTGDMRYSPSLENNEHIAAAAKEGVSSLFLDTTYCHPKYSFPEQRESIQYVVDTVTEMMAGGDQGSPSKHQRCGGKRIVYVISTYVIGKERILTALAQKTGCKIHVSERKFGIFQAMGLDNVETMFTTDPAQSNVRVVSWGVLGDTWPFFKPNFVNMEKIRVESGADEVVGFCATGWLYEMKRTKFPVRKKGPLSVHLVPYSEHSSYNELRAYVSFLRPGDVVPTVGVDGESSQKNRDKMLKHFSDIVRETASKESFLKLFEKSPADGHRIESEPGDSKDLLKNHPSEVGKDHFSEIDENESELEKVRAVTGAPLPVAQDLLRRGGNDVTRAIEMFFDGAVDGAPATEDIENEPTHENEEADARSGQDEATMILIGAGVPKDAARILLDASGGDVHVAINRFLDHGIPIEGKVPSTEGAPAMPSHDASSSKKRSLIPEVASPTSAEAKKQKTQKTIQFFFSKGGHESNESMSAAAPASEISASPPAAAFQAIIPHVPEHAVPSSSASKQSPVAPKPFNMATPKECPLSFAELSVKEYDPYKHSCWEQAEPLPYMHIARVCKVMESTKKRLIIGDALTNMIRSVIRLAPQDLLSTIYLTSGVVADDHEGVELSVGGGTISSALVEATGTTRGRLRELYRKHGDIGDVAESCKISQKTLMQPKALTVSHVHKVLMRIAREKGQGSASRRQAAVVTLLQSCRDYETRYLVRTLIQNMRVGANRRTVVGAIGRAFLLDGRDAKPKATKEEQDAAAKAVQEAYEMCPSFAELIPRLLEKGLAGASDHVMVAGIPMAPMLAKICGGAVDAAEQLGPVDEEMSCVLAEHKYDGQRAQIHIDLEKNACFVFSRNGEDKTAAYPDVVQYLQDAMGSTGDGSCKSAIFDAEVVAVDRSNNNAIMAFQHLSTRARGAVDVSSISVHVCVFVFDLLSLDGAPLLSRCLRERRELLRRTLPNMRAGRVEIARSTEVAICKGLPEEASVEMKELVDAAFAAGTEGLMLKRLDTKAAYEPGRRSGSWIKLKRDYESELRDSLDLVPIGAWHGNGRKVKWFSPILLAVWDAENEEYQSVCRVMSGFTDSFYEAATKRLSETIIPEPKPYYRTGERCSVWFEPSEVWEITGADFTISPVHQAAVGRVHPDRGISVRFPRFLRIREDKSIEDTTSPDQMAEMFEKQSRKVTVPNGGGNGEVGHRSDDGEGVEDDQ